MKRINKYVLMLVVFFTALMISGQSVFALELGDFGFSHVTNQVAVTLGLQSASTTYGGYSIGALFFGFILPLITIFIFLDMIMSFTFEHFSPFRRYTRHKTILSIIFTLSVIPLGLINIIMTYAMGVGTISIVGVFLAAIAIFWFKGKHESKSLAKNLMDGGRGFDFKELVDEQKQLMAKRQAAYNKYREIKQIADLKRQKVEAKELGLTDKKKMWTPEEKAKFLEDLTDDKQELSVAEERLDTASEVVKGIDSQVKVVQKKSTVTALHESAYSDL